MRPAILKDLFPELSDDRLIKELIEHGSIQSFKRGEVIIDYGDYIEFVPLVLSGFLKIIREGDQGQELLLYFLNAGTSCAASFSCCMAKKRSEIKAICEEASTVMLIPIEKANLWMETHARWRDFVISMYDSRLFALIDTIDNLAFAQLDEKLLNYLQEMSLLKSSTKLTISHQQIAIDLNASRESISRLLKKLEAKKMVSLNRNEITILSV